LEHAASLECVKQLVQCSSPEACAAVLKYALSAKSTKIAELMMEKVDLKKVDQYDLLNFIVSNNESSKVRNI
jgi:acetyl-CoA carboxylase alpha subunit